MASPHPLIGQQLGHYRILDQIGAGGMGVVLHARDERLERDVAIKLLPPNLLSNVPSRKRIQAEARALSRLNHPNIAVLYDYDTQGETDFLVMEFVTGQSLSDKLSGLNLPEKLVLELCVQVASALEEAHEQGIIHCDLSPGNIMVTGKGQVKVLDFGLAKLIPKTPGKELTSTLAVGGSISGTLPYMAPEQLSDESPDCRSDLYALGTVMYEMATGRRAFPEQSMPRLVEAILHSVPPPPSELNRNVSANLERVIQKAMDPDPNRRYQSAKELRVDLERVRRPAVGAPPVRTSHWKRWFAIAGVIVVALLFGTLYAWHARSRPIDSIAVLPLSNDTPNSETEYLCDGITESLIDRLSQLPQLRVMARTTVFRFKSQQPDVVDIGNKLGVRVVLAGRVQRRDDSVDIRVELVNVSDGAELWGARYYLLKSDLLRVQEEIAEEISNKLRLRLTGQEHKLLTKRYTQDVESYQFYLKGRHYAEQYTLDGFQRAIEAFQQAAQRDPKFALAYSGMAEAYYGVSSQFLKPRDAMPRVREASSQALAIDETLAEPHALLGIVEAFYEHDFSGAEKELKRGVELNPGSSSAHVWYGYYLIPLGRFREAIAELKRAEQIDPLSPTVGTLLGIARFYGRDYDAAITQLQSMTWRDPGDWMAHFYLGFTYEQIERHEEARAELEKASLSGGSPLVKAYQVYAEAASGNKQKALEILTRLQQQRSQNYVPWAYMAYAHLGVGEEEHAFDDLQQAYEDREDGVVFVNVDPTYDRFRNHPRLQTLVRQIGLVP